MQKLASNLRVICSMPSSLHFRAAVFFALFYSIVLGSLCFAADDALLRGSVKGPTGLPIANATVTIDSVRGPQVTRTDNYGAFAIPNAPERATLIVEAPGFSSVRKTLSAAMPNPAIVMSVAPSREQITVTPTRTDIAAANTPSVTVVPREQIRDSGAVTVDDALRQVPGFTLFRRSGSATANPTTLGVSLRGVGASGASRALVLSDGVPLNDPFGGWIYWGRVPREAIDRVEVVRGGASSLYGSGALGGVINILPLAPQDTTLSVETSMGNLNTPSVSAIGSARLGAWIGTLSGEAFRTHGYVNVPADLRGSVDTVTNSEHRTGQAQVARTFSDRARIFFDGSIYSESRNNGKVGERNSANIRQLDLGTDLHSSAAGDFAFRLFGGTEGLRQNFFAVAPDRNSDSLTRDQTVPASQVGVSAVWSRRVAWNHFVAGADARWIDGESAEILSPTGTATSLVRAGGSQRTFGAFGEDLLQLTSRLLVTLSGRVDRWANYDGRVLTLALAPSVTDSARLFADRDELAFSPRVGSVYRLTDRISLNASYFKAFRAPTLNELYRNFRVGSVLTLANENLRAEHLNGAEVGAVTTLTDRLRVRSTYFWNSIEGPVANVTLAITPALITRQRQNLGETRSRGVEIEGGFQLRPSLAFTAGYQFADATVVSSPGNTVLEGSQLPQVPRHEVTFTTRYSNPRFLTLALQGRFQGQQYDDDRNQLPLESFFQLDAFVSHSLRRNAEIFIAGENLLNNQYVIGRTPVPTIAAPISARAGIRLRFGGR